MTSKTIGSAATAIDFYKTGHKFQYEEGTELVYANFTPRSSKYANLPHHYDQKVVCFGIQAFILDYLIKEWNETFFNKPRMIAVGMYQRRLDNALGVGAVDVSHIGELHDMGFLPLRIAAIPEGEAVDIGVPMLTIFNTNPRFFWLVNYIETVMSSELWKPCTTATIAREYRRLVEMYAEKTGADLSALDFQCHDFSARGMSGRHDASISGMGHLLSFVGTDTVSAIDSAEEYYFANTDSELIGTSVPATEHSVMCMSGKDDEKETFRRLICDLYPTGIVSIVSDTWDYWKVITEFLPEMKELILARQPNALGLAKTVIRPDSGDPVHIISGYRVGELWELENYFSMKDVDKAYCGYNNVYDATNNEVFQSINGGYYKIDDWAWNSEKKVMYTVKGAKEIPEHEVKGTVGCMWDIFGGTETGKGYKVLHERIGLIYGDSITLARAEEIMIRLMEKGFASTNIVFGVGSYTYQYVTRDTFGFAVKATAGFINKELVELQKDPKTDSGSKKSATGLLRVEKENGSYVLYERQTVEQEQQGELKEVFRDGILLTKQTFSQIRERVKRSLIKEEPEGGNNNESEDLPV